MSAVATAAGGAHPGGSSDRAATAPGAGVPSREPRVGKWQKVGGLEKLPNWAAAQREALHTEYQAHPFVLGSDPNVTTFKASLLARLDGLPGGSPSANDIKLVTGKLVDDMSHHGPCVKAAAADPELQKSNEPEYASRIRWSKEIAKALNQQYTLLHGDERASA